MIRQLFKLNIIVLLLVGCEIEREPIQEAYERIDTYAEQLMAQYNTPGMTLIITDPEGTIHTASYGFEDVKTRSPVTSSSLFQIGSISKSFTSIALLQLHERGKVDVHEPLTAYLPWFSVRSEYDPITPHHLATHTAGIPRDRDDIPPSWYSAYALRDRDVAAPPGERYSYSNIGYQTLGVFLESVTEKPYSEIIQSSILGPLGMDNTAPVIINEIRPRLATGYTYLYDDRPSHPDHPVVETTFFEYLAADGSISSTAEDMAKYMRMIMNRGEIENGRILSGDSFDKFIQRAIQLDEDGQEFYGYGLNISEREDDRIIISHGGGMVGYRTMMIVDITTGIGVFAAVNGPGSPGSIGQFALDALYATLHEHDLPELPEMRDRMIVENADEYEGTYLTPEGEQITFEASDKSLFLRENDEKIFLEYRGGDRFYANHPDHNIFFFTFKRNEEEVREVTYGSKWYVSDQYDGSLTFDYPERWQAYPGHYRTQNPWFNNFRIILRKGRLFLVLTSGIEIELSEIEPGMFRVGEEPTADRLRFDTVVDDRTLRTNFSGVDFYRVMKKR